MLHSPAATRPDSPSLLSGRVASPEGPTYPMPTGREKVTAMHPTPDTPAGGTINGRRPDLPLPTDPPTHPTYRPTDTPDLPTRTSDAMRRVLTGVSVALGAVILAPLALSGQDLYQWAKSPTGLNLDQPWPWLVPVALDLAAAACIGMTIVAVWRRERAGVFGALVWLFALVSAFGQYRHGIAERAAGRAQDLWWAMPAFALLGPLLLEVTLNKIRKWARKDAGEQHVGAAGFGVRWVVAPLSTLSAWAVSRREGISRADDALRFVQDRRTVKRLAAVEAVHYAFGALRSTDPHEARVWLTARGVSATQADIGAALARHMSPPAPVGMSPDRVASTDLPTDRQGEVASVVKLTRPAPRHRAPKATARRSPTHVGTPVGSHSAAAVTNAADLRRRYPDTLPTDYQIRKATGWSPERVKPARAAYEAGADLTQKESS